MSSARLRVRGAGSVDSVMLDVKKFEITEGDLLMACLLTKSHILANTSIGRDYNDGSFAPYNDSRPFYYYPAGPVGRERSSAQLKKDKAAVKRFGRSVGRAVSGTTSAVSRSGLGIKFQSYQAFKGTYLGRGGVDLMGPRAPHMLQAIAIQAGGLEVPAGQNRRANMSPDEGASPCRTARLGIYGNESIRASGINSDDRPKGMPLRRFFAVSDRVAAAAAKKIEDRLLSRMLRRGEAVIVGNEIVPIDDLFSF
jgi:hypothetical protein